MTPIELDPIADLIGTDIDGERRRADTLHARPYRTHDQRPGTRRSAVRGSHA